MNRHAFTLIEVLFAVVLLSLVVSVCVPYMRAAPQGVVPGDLTTFSADVDEEIYKLQLSQSEAPTLEQIGEAVFSLGGRCKALSVVDTKIKGQWITITDGTHTILRWAYMPNIDTPDGDDGQAVTP